MGANAVTTVPVYTAGEVLTAADMNITNSGIPVFATTVTRDAAFGGTGEKTLAEGQACFIEGTGLQVYNGTVWRPYGYRQTYTPTFTNFTLGNGTIDYANYVQVDDLIQVSVQVSLGSTSVMGSDPQISLPVTSAIQQFASQYGASFYLDNGASYYSGIVYSATGQTTATMGIENIGGTYPTYAGVSATAPFTWGSTDKFNIYFTYTV